MKKTEQKAIATKVLNSLTPKMEYSSIKTQLITTYEFGNEQNIHMDIALIERDRVKALITIEYDADENMYDVWNFVTLGNYFRKMIIDRVYIAINQLNAENGHYEDNE